MTKEDTKNKKTSEEETQEEFSEAINQKPESLKPKLLALYKNQNKRDDILEKGYNEEFYTIEYGYNLKYNEINESISKIISEGTPIPEYWKKAIENSKFFPCNDKDKEILKHLKNIELKHDENDKKSFTVYFHFESNSYFEGTVLEKKYIFNKKEDTFTEAQTNEIKWTADAPNIKIVKKKIKKGKTSSTITKEKKVESFFNIFEKKDEDEDEDDDDDKNKESDDMLGEEAEFILNDLVPFSMEYYLDIQKLSALDDDYGDDDDDDEEEDDHPKGKRSKK